MLLLKIHSFRGKREELNRPLKGIKMASANATEDSLREMLTCPICMDEFRSPRSLPCLHTFCQVCLGDYLVRKHVRPGTTFPCPTCRESVFLPKEGVKGLRSNFLIKSMLGILDSKEDVPNVSTKEFEEESKEPQKETEPEDEKEGKKGEVEKEKRFSQKQLMFFKAKEDKLKECLVKAEQHAETLKEYNTKVGMTMGEIASSKEKLKEKIKDRAKIIREEVDKYESVLCDRVENEMNIETELKPFEEAAGFVNEDLENLQGLVQFSNDVLQSGSLETVATVTDDVRKNIEKILKRDLKQLEWKSLSLEIPDVVLGEQLGNVMGILKPVTVASDGAHAVLANQETFMLIDLTERPGQDKISEDRENQAGYGIHDDPDIRILPKYSVRKQFPVAPTTATNMAQFDVTPLTPTRPIRSVSSPPAHVEFEAVKASPPIPPRKIDVVNMENSPKGARKVSSSPVTKISSNERAKDEKEKTSTEHKKSPRSRRSQGAEASGQSVAISKTSANTTPKVQKPPSNRRSIAMLLQVTLKPYPAVISATLRGTINTGFDGGVHDLLLTRNNELCILGQRTEKDGKQKVFMLFDSDGKKKFEKTVSVYDASYNTASSFTTLIYKDSECVAIPVPEDGRIKILPIESMEGAEVIRSLHHKYKNMLYRPFHVKCMNDKLWSLGLDSFGRDSYDTRSNFDEWHPQSYVWDISTVENSEGSPVKPDCVLIPCPTLPSSVQVNEANSKIYICEDQAVSCIQISGRGGGLLWKYGETAKKKQRLRDPQGLHVDDSSGRVFVASVGGDKVVALSTEGQFLQTVVSERHGVRRPSAVALDPTGQLIVGQLNGAVKYYKLTT